jgi:hypothetical protein
MTRQEELKQEAISIANDLKQEYLEDDKELASLKAKIATLEARVSARPDPYVRAKEYVGAADECPYCWVRRGIASPLKPVGGGTTTLDFFRCRECGYQKDFPA